MTSSARSTWQFPRKFPIRTLQELVSFRWLCVGDLSVFFQGVVRLYITTASWRRCSLFLKTHRPAKFKDLQKDWQIACVLSIVTVFRQNRTPPQLLRLVHLRHLTATFSREGVEHTHSFNFLQARCHLLTAFHKPSSSFKRAKSDFTVSPPVRRHEIPFLTFQNQEGGKTA